MNANATGLIRKMFYVIMLAVAIPAYAQIDADEPINEKTEATASEGYDIPSDALHVAFQNKYDGYDQEDIGIIHLALSQGCLFPRAVLHISKAYQLEPTLVANAINAVTPETAASVDVDAVLKKIDEQKTR